MAWLWATELDVQFSSLHPLIKVAAWFALLAVLAAGVQCIAWLVGLEIGILDGNSGGRGVLLTLAVLSLMMVMSADRQPMRDYGLIVGPKWKKLWHTGLAAGAATFFIFMSVAVALGTTSLNTGSLTIGGCLKAIASAFVTAIPLALAQQVIFNGYLLSTLRKGMNRTLAVLVCGMLFAVVGRLHEPQLLLDSSTQALLVGLFLVAALLGALRLATGSVVLPAGVLAGWILLSRTAYKLDLFATDYSNPATAWMVPGGEPRRSPVLWGVLVAASVATWLWLRRKGEPKISADQASIDANFKRTFPLVHATASAPLDVWLRLLVAAKLRIGLEYAARLVFVLSYSTVATIISLPERLLVPLLLRRRSVREPIFILGVQRSGTTHLHNLLALDRQFITPRAWQVYRPIGSLLTGSLFTPFAAVFARGTRPMDQMRFSQFAPSEEEFSIAASSRMSPLWGMTFPQIWPEFDRYMFPDRLPAKDRNAWKQLYRHILSKITLLSRDKQPLLKNPYNTGRVAILREMFPKAKFIHICRHPYDVYRSNMHMAREGHVLNQLQNPDAKNSYQTRFLDNYAAMEFAYETEISHVAASENCELRFEDLEHDPSGELKRIYRELGLTWTKPFEERLHKYLRSIADYQKNRHKELPYEARARIDLKMGRFMDRWGYKTASTGTSAANDAA